MSLSPCLGTFCIFQSVDFEPIASKELKGKEWTFHKD